ncbi:hypothetical protein KI655_19755 [Vibrio sp. D404a]|uniref:hypothetical protein n=1 Tax=unclassified Vibrio TaxID=2614977 RepID=UPI002556FED8|nr:MULTISPECIES: hypothetical protein [unclassified Vibrio]MDK9739529.1 hypothetical protein [Vibrio sp. D404a]MDK9797278.1 hypothetical protein [Vibrio sp. D449a]
MSKIKKKDAELATHLLEEYRTMTSIESFQLDVLQSLVKVLSANIKSLDDNDRAVLVVLAKQHIDVELDFSQSVGFDDAQSKLSEFKTVINVT